MCVYSTKCCIHCKLLATCLNALFPYSTIANIYNDHFCVTQNMGIEYHEEIDKLVIHNVYQLMHEYKCIKQISVFI
jgi:hypothetical protein